VYSRRLAYTLTFNGNDQLGNHRQDLVASLLQHFVHTHDAQEAVRVELFTDTIEENGQVMVVVQFFTRNFPDNLVANTSVVDFNGQVSAVIESSEFRLGNVTLVLSVSLVKIFTTGGIGLNYSLGLLELTQFPPLPREVFSTLSNLEKH
jgi:hypothetical protein